MKFQNTKLLRRQYQDYLKADNDGNLFEFYATFSNEKYKALESCKRYMNKLNGKNLQIISANGWAFTVGFTFTTEDNRKAFCFITKDNTRYMYI